MAVTLHVDNQYAVDQIAQALCQAAGLSPWDLVSIETGPDWVEQRPRFESMRQRAAEIYIATRAMKLMGLL